MARTPSKVAKRYARALFDSFEPAKLEGVQQSLQALSNAWEESENLRTVLQHPGIALSERLAVVGDLAAKVGDTDGFLGNFAKLLLENSRIALLPEVSDAFSILLDLLKKRLSLEIVSAFEIDNSEREQVLEKVRRDFGGLANIQWSVDKAIIGGLRVQAGDLLLDGSIAGALADLRNSLVQ